MATAPILISLWNPVTSKILHTWCSLGDVPSRVAKAAESFLGANKSSSAAGILRDYYGPHYATLLGGHIPRGVHGGCGSGDANGVISGGDSELDIIENLLREDDTLRTPSKATRDIMKRQLAAYPTWEPGAEVAGVAIFPDDDFMTLKHKFHVITNIPAYRQHLFAREGPETFTTYDIFSEITHKVDMFAYTAANGAAGTPLADVILGDIRVDKALYSARETVRIEARDTFDLLRLHPITHFFVVDLAMFCVPIRTQLVDILGDKHRLTMIYYGFVIKYWPMLTYEVFIQYILNEHDLSSSYPELALNVLALASRFAEEEKIMFRVARNKKKAAASLPIVVAITQFIATVRNVGVACNIRNIFDKYHVTKCIPEINAHVEHEGVRYMLQRKHRTGTNIAFPTALIFRTGITFAIIVTARGDYREYMFFNVQPNGRYYIKANWGEEDALTFPGVAKILIKFTDPIITAINAMGRLAMSYGSILPKVTRDNIAYQGLNVSIIWKRVILAPAFRVARSAWEQYSRAGIMISRPTTQADRYEFTYRKGIYQYDHGLIDRVLVMAGTADSRNQYNYLTTALIFQKWMLLYGGRIVQMINRVTDVKFDVIDIRDDEFQIFYEQIVVYIRGLIDRPDFQQALETRATNDASRLRKMQIQDPSLYNLRKYNSDRLPSKMCQGERQPIIYTDDELSRMSDVQKRRLFEYWNFTLNRPAFYECPSKLFPNLGFITGVHPAGFCLPCCNKKADERLGERKSIMHTACNRDHVYEAEDELTSRHIMTYGKDLKAGRLSYLPPSVVELFFVDPPFYLEGVGGRTSVFGMLDAIALAFNPAGTGAALANQLADGITDHIFDLLLNGTLFQYTDSVQLRADLRAGDVAREIDWPTIFTELVFHIVKVAIIVITSNNIEIAQIVVDHVADQTSEMHDYILLAKPGPHIWYPIVQADAIKYYHDRSVIRRMYPAGDPIIGKIRQVIVKTEHVNARGDTKWLTLETAAQIKGWRIVKKFANIRNLCYAVLMSAGNAQFVYVPIEYTVYRADDVPVSYKPMTRAEEPLKGAALHEFMSLVGKVLGRTVQVGDPAIISGRIIGYYAAHTDATYLNTMYLFYVTDGDTIAPGTLPDQELGFDPVEINQAIMSRRVTAAPGPNVGRAIYINNVYNLLLLELENWSDKQKNTEIREKCRRGKGRQLPPELSRADRARLSIAMQMGGEKAFEQVLAGESFEFDKYQLTELIDMPRAEALKKITAIVAEFAIEGEIGETVEFPNIYAACAYTSANYCTREKKLIVSKLTDYVEILTDDLQNPLVATTIVAGANSMALVDYFKFETTSDSVVVINKLSGSS